MNPTPRMSPMPRMSPIRPTHPEAESTDSQGVRGGTRHGRIDNLFRSIKKAAYRFSDILTVDIVPHGPDIECTLQFHKRLTDAESRAAIAAFKSEVLDQDLRVTIAKETEGIRNAILAYALSKTGLQSGE